MKGLSILITAVLAIVLAYAILGLRTNPDAKRETAYERILRTGTIRCGYINWRPAVARDPETGKMEGYVVDYIEALAKALEVKVVWQEEINLGTYLEDLKSGRYDLECAGGWPNAVRGKFAYYTRPFAYSPLVPFVRADDARFDRGVESLNASGLTAAVMDGDTGQVIRRSRFPHMKEVSLPQLSTIHEYFVVVATGKADVTFSDYIGGIQYMEKNPGKIKPLPYILRQVPQNIGVPLGETNLLMMLNTATEQLILDGTIDEILDKYHLDPDMFIRAKASP